jgi:hypothetical protein
MRFVLMAALFFSSFASHVAAQPLTQPERDAALAAEARLNAERAAALEARLAFCRTKLDVIGEAEGEEVKKESEKFKELGFGGGYAAVVNLDGRPKLEADGDAQVVGGVVRINKDEDVQFGPILELHKFVGTLASKKLAKVGGVYLRGEEVPPGCAPEETVEVPLIGVGPIATVRFGSDGNMVQSFGIGVMFGFRKDSSDNSLNIGIAYVTDLDAKTLGDGIEEGKALPNGETAIRFKTTNLEGVMVLVSVGW